MAGDRAGNSFEGAAGVRPARRQRADDDRQRLCAVFAHQGGHRDRALQLVEQGRLDLDAPAKRYAPEIATLQVLEGFDEAGAPKLRPPKREITTRMLLLHTAGFGYPFWNPICKRLAERDPPDRERSAR